RHVIVNGLPGSGHTRPDHPMLDWIEPRLDESLQQQMQQVRSAARQPETASRPQPVSMTEIEPSEPVPVASEEAPTAEASASEAESFKLWLIAVSLLLLLIGG